MNRASWLAVLAIVLAIADGALFLAWAQPTAALAPHAEDPLPNAAPAAAPPAAVDVATPAPARSADLATPMPVTRISATADTAIVFGTVRLADGTPANGHAWLSGDGAPKSGASITAGTFLFAGVPPGRFTFRTRIEQAMPAEREVQVVAPRTRLDVQLDAAWLLTVNAVTPEGLPLQEALAKAAPNASTFGGVLTALAFAEPIRGDLPPTALRQPTGGLGEFRGDDRMRGGSALPKQTLGVLTLPPDRPAHVALLLRSAVVATQLVAAGQTEVVFTVPVADVTARLGKVRLRLLDPTGNPLPKVQVALNDQQSGGGGKATDAEGRVVLEHLRPGRLGLEVRHASLRPPAVQIDVAGGADLDLGDIVLLKRSTVTLRIAGADDTTRATSTALAGTLPGWARPSSNSLRVEKGEVTAWLPAGRHGVYVATATHCAFVELDTTALPAQPIEVALAPGAPLRLRCRMGGGTGVAIVRSPRGICVFDRDLNGNWEQSLCVPPGAYEVEFTVGNGTPQRRTLTVPREGAELTFP
jgi:hypothetical protein